MTILRVAQGEIPGRVRQAAACGFVRVHSRCATLSGSCLATQSAAYSTMPGYSLDFLNGVPQSAQMGIASPSFSQTCGACTKRYSDPSGRSVQSPKITRGLSVRGRGISMISVRRLRPLNHRATFSRAAARDSAEPIGKSSGFIVHTFQHGQILDRRGCFRSQPEPFSLRLRDAIWVMLVQAVRLVASNVGIFLCLPERRPAIWTSGNLVARLQPNARNIDPLPKHSVLPLLPFAETHTRTVLSRPRNMPDDSEPLAAVVSPSE